MCISFGCSNSRSCESHSDDTMRLVLRNCLNQHFHWLRYAAARGGTGGRLQLLVARRCRSCRDCHCCEFTDVALLVGWFWVWFFGLVCWFLACCSSSFVVVVRALLLLVLRPCSFVCWLCCVSSVVSFVGSWPFLCCLSVFGFGVFVVGFGFWVLWVLVWLCRWLRWGFCADIVIS